MPVIGRVYHGRVQGVGFRATAQRLARSLDLDGWVRNEPDGTVRLVASGKDDLIDRLERAIDERLGHGVTTVDPFDVPTDDTPRPGEGFEVRR